ncbi:hypothetical protein F4860DRAFT_428206 [Xylaria cubensis]|nr:hypothetical protein F4860DRAFT_428206 [Xylaria cubensis]
MPIQAPYEGLPYRTASRHHPEGSHGPEQHLLEPPSDPETLGSELEVYLQQFQRQNAPKVPPGYPMLQNNQDNYPYVHPRVISFHDEQDKANWMNHMPDAETRDCFSHFAGPLNTDTRHFKVAVFSVPNGLLIGDQWKERIWHVFLVAIIKARDSKGKYVLIWDCDPVGVPPMGRWKALLFGKQRSFIEYLREKRKMTTAEVWYNTYTGDGGKERCLPNSLKKLTEWARLGDLPYQGVEDVRFQDCVQLQA